MAKIYIIKNLINGKIYVGKTENSIEKRFLEHKRDSCKTRCSRRPLYDAMNKYGTDNFSIELIEDTDEPEEKEIYYIKKLNSYVGFENSNGYNATLGGDGSKYLDIDTDKLLNDYINCTKNTIKMLSKEYDVCEDSIRAVLRSNNIEIRNAGFYTAKSIKKYSKDNVLIKIYANIAEIRLEMDIKDQSHINACIRGKRKTAYGFIWRS